MKALQYLAPGQPEIVDVPLPEPGPGEVRVKVLRTNTCPHWDLHLFSGEPMFPGRPLPYPYPPGQPGHEMVGLVDAIGPGVEGFEAGQLVAAWKDPGHTRPGCYAEQVVLAADHLLPAPAGTDPRQIASLELAMCVAGCILDLRQVDAIAARTAAVNGLGPAGLIAAQMLRAEGALPVLGIDPHPGRRELALAARFVDEVHDPAADTVPLRRPGRIDCAVDCCGLPGAVGWLMDRTRRHLALFAVQRDDYTYAPRHAGLTVHGYGGHSRRAADYALAKCLSGEVDLKPLLTVELPLERYVEGVELLRRQAAVKVSFLP